MLANGPGYVDVCDHSGCYGLTLKGTPDELEALASNLKAAAALDRSRRGQGPVARVS